MTNNPNVPINLDSQIRPRDAFERMHRQYEQLAETDLERVNLDITTVAAIVLAVLSALKALRPEIAPSLWTGRGRRPTRKATKPQPEATSRQELQAQAPATSPQGPQVLTATWAQGPQVLTATSPQVPQVQPTIGAAVAGSAAITPVKTKVQGLSWVRHGFVKGFALARSIHAQP